MFLIYLTKRKRKKYQLSDDWLLSSLWMLLIGFEYNYLNFTGELVTARVYYEKNLQADVIGLLDARGAEIATYQRYRDYYWIASQVSYSRKRVKKTTYFPCMPITKSKAIVYAKLGENIFASSVSSSNTFLSSGCISSFVILSL